MRTSGFRSSGIAITTRRSLETGSTRTSNERFYFCRFTQLTVLRLLTTSAIMGADVRTMIGAWKVWESDLI